MLQALCQGIKLETNEPSKMWFLPSWDFHAGSAEAVIRPTMQESCEVAWKVILSEVGLEAWEGSLRKQQPS